MVTNIDKNPKARFFACVCNNPSEDQYKSLRSCVQRTEVNYIRWQLEIGADQKTPHLQIYLEIAKKGNVRFTAVQKTVCRGLHMEEVYSSREKAMNYVWKDKDPKGGQIFPESREEYGTISQQGNRTAQFDGARNIILGKRSWRECMKDSKLDSVTSRYPNWVKGVLSIRERELPNIEPMKLWKENLMKLMETKPTHRQILNIWSTQSMMGKTDMANYICLKYDGINFGSDMDYKRNVHAYDEEKVIIYDLPRNTKFIDYCTLEQISNHGLHYTSFQNPRKVYIAAHIIVFSNEKLKEEKIPGRLSFVNIDEEKAIEKQPINDYFDLVD